MRLLLFTGTRAEYGLLEPLIKICAARSEISCVSLLISGSHLSDDFGNTLNDIKLGLIDEIRTFDILLEADTKTGLLKSLALLILSLSDEFKNFSYDKLLVIGDRYETLGVSLAAHVCGIPIVHFHGGEMTEGMLDQTFRTLISKMASVHFVSNKQSRDRLLALDIDPNSIFVSGPLANYAIQAHDFLDRAVLEQELAIAFGNTSVLVCVHPETSSKADNRKLIESIVEAIEACQSIQFFISAANADPGGNEFNKALRSLARRCKHVSFKESFGSRYYYSMLKNVDAILGNSSSGIIEAYQVGTVCVNVGERQKGRDRNGHVIEIPADVVSICDALVRIQELRSNKEISRVDQCMSLESVFKIISRHR